jgi:hypothetical protein
MAKLAPKARALSLLGISGKNNCRVFKNKSKSEALVRDAIREIEARLWDFFEYLVSSCKALCPCVPLYLVFYLLKKCALSRLKKGKFSLAYASHDAHNYFYYRCIVASSTYQVITI